MIIISVFCTCRNVFAFVPPNITVHPQTHLSTDGGRRNLSSTSTAANAATITSLPSVKWALPAAVNAEDDEDADEDVTNSVHQLLYESELADRRYRSSPSIVKHRAKSLRLNQPASTSKATARERFIVNNTKYHLTLHNNKAHEYILW